MEMTWLHVTWGRPRLASDLVYPARLPHAPVQSPISANARQGFSRRPRAGSPWLAPPAPYSAMHFHDIPLGYCAWWTCGPQPATHVKRIRTRVCSSGHSRRQLLANAAIAAIGAWRLADRPVRAERPLCSRMLPLLPGTAQRYRLGERSPSFFKLLEHPLPAN